MPTHLTHIAARHHIDDLHRYADGFRRTRAGRPSKRRFFV
jgi:hypothetical protein